MRVSSLAIYPLKSGRGIALDTSAVERAGLSGDRRLMLVSPDGQFITQRELPALAALVVTPSVLGYRLSLAGRGSLDVTFSANTRKNVAVWRTIVSASPAPDACNATLSDWFGRPMELVFFDDAASRNARDEWTGEDTPVGFADGYPVLITTTASLEALNADMRAHGEGTAGMERFRPNIVIDGADAWDEDRWAAIEIGGLRYDLVKPCARCIMTTQDQETGSREVPSPMPAMGRIRMSADRRVPGVLFGWNAAPRGTGSISVGDAVKVLESRAEGWALKQRRPPQDG